jgi:hypothetical protein
MTIDIHLAAVIVATLVAFALGGLWYSPLLFARAWMRAAGLDEAAASQGNMTRIYGLALLGTLVMALNLAAFIGAKATLAFGLFAGFATGLGWIAMALAVVYLFERRSLRLWLINAGYQVVAMSAMGAVIGAWPA